MLNIGHNRTKEKNIMDYKKAYNLLFSGITRALEEIDKASIKSSEIISSEIILKQLQKEAENMYIEDE
jgi:hypothetical protein